jgi:hypothetical protein
MSLRPPADTDDTRAALERHGLRDVTALGGSGVVFLFEAFHGDERCLVTTRSSAPRDVAELRRTLAYAATVILPLRSIDVIDQHLSALVEARGVGDPVLSRAPLGTEELGFVLGSIGRTLAALHAAGTIVGGLDPSLVFVTGAAGHARLAGFTPRARAFLDGAFDAVLDGAPLFDEIYAPLDAAATPASDVFSFAATWVKLATGQHPFGHGATAQLRALVRGTAPLVGMTGEVGGLVARALSRSAFDRPPLEALLHALA